MACLKPACRFSKTCLLADSRYSKIFAISLYLIYRVSIPALMSRPMWPRNYSQRVSIYNLLILKIGKISITLTYHRQNCPTGQPSTKKCFYLSQIILDLATIQGEVGEVPHKMTSLARWGGIPKLRRFIKADLVLASRANLCKYGFVVRLVS